MPVKYFWINLQLKFPEEVVLNYQGRLENHNLDLDAPWKHEPCCKI